MSRTKAIFDDLLERSYRRTDRMFLWLLIAQWVFAVILAAIISPYTYDGRLQAMHFHVEVAIGFGGLINALPIALIIMRPGWWVTRHSVAVVQMLWSALLIMITGGRIETHFHVFGSLAFLAFYRDWKVLPTATIIVSLDHLTREVLWPESVYGIANPEWWRFLEHAAWVAFEDVVLVFACVRGVRELRETARHASELEIINAAIERRVQQRTQALHDAKERYRSLVENIQAVPFEYDLVASKLLYIGPQAERILERELVGDVLFGPHVHHEDLARVQAALRSCGPHNSPALDYRLDSDRGIVYLRVFMSSDGARVHGVALNITRQMTLEHELRQAQKLESVGRLAAGMAHEINTPMQFVNDSVSFIQDALPDLMKLARYSAETETAADVDLAELETSMPEAIDCAVTGIHRVTEIVRSIKAFAHPDQGGMVECDLNQAIRNTLTIARGEYKHVAELDTDFAELPLVTCHAGEISQVVLNLVVNAAHAIGDVMKGTRVGRIRIATRLVADTHVEIAISDTGGGIPDAVRERIFDPFFTTKEVGRGTGQGLAIARSLIEKHHGRIVFDSEVGVGTIFYIRLPVAQPQLAAA